jgi:hypothetical protein
VQSCQESISSLEFSEWMAFARLQPFGESRMDYRFAMLAALVANLWTDSRKKRWTPDDFMPDFEQALDAREAQEEAKPVSVADKVKAFFGMLVQANRQAEGKKQEAGRGTDADGHRAGDPQVR